MQPFLTRFTIAILLFFILPGSLFAQLSAGGLPPGFVDSSRDHQLSVYIIDTPETGFLLKEDAANEKLGIAERVGVFIPVDFDPERNGNWHTLVDGRLQWRIEIQVPGAKQVAAYFDEFYLSHESELFIYDISRTTLLGAFTKANNHESRLFATEMIAGDGLIFELITSKAGRSETYFRIADILFGYKESNSLKSFGTAGACNVNVNCDEGVNWQNQKRGVVKIISRVGSQAFSCSGTLLNNTAYDFAPYVYTADHCARSGVTYSTTNDFNQWIFYFNYEAEQCQNPPVEPKPISMTGASLKAIVGGGSIAAMQSDFCLVLLNEKVPTEAEPYFNGWSRINQTSPRGVSIHHPRGDIKKVSTYNTPLFSTSYPGTSTTANMYWRVIWSATANGHGVTEGGSSGSPLFNEQGLVIGQLTGGNASCTNLNAPDYYGKFSHSWESVGSRPDLQLKPWLDPENTGAETLQGSFDVLNVIANFGADTVALQTDQKISFKDFSKNEPTSWKWLFPGGEPSESTLKDPGFVTYRRFGRFDVTLIVSNDVSADTLYRRHYIQVVPGMFPNPASNEVRFLLGAHDYQQLNIEIHDITGRPVESIPYQISGLFSVKIDTRPYRRGIYVVTMIADGETIARQKLVLAR